MTHSQKAFALVSGISNAPRLATVAATSRSQPNVIMKIYCYFFIVITYRLHSLNTIIRRTLCSWKESNVPYILHNAHGLCTHSVKYYCENNKSGAISVLHTFSSFKKCNIYMLLLLLLGWKGICQIWLLLGNSLCAYCLPTTNTHMNAFRNRIGKMANRKGFMLQKKNSNCQILRSVESNKPLLQFKKLA